MERHAKNIALRGMIVGLSESGVSPTEIAAEVGLSRATVYRWLKRWQEEHTLEDRPRPGQSRITTAAEDQRIVDDVLTHPFTNAVATRDRLQLPVSANLIRRRLHENEIHHRTPAKKQKLTDRHHQLRLQFSQQYLDEGLDYWSRVIFSDEKTFASTSHGKIHCWRRNNAR